MATNDRTLTVGTLAVAMALIGAATDALESPAAATRHAQIATAMDSADISAGDQRNKQLVSGGVNFSSGSLNVSTSRLFLDAEGLRCLAGAPCVPHMRIGSLEVGRETADVEQSGSIAFADQLGLQFR